MGKVHGQRHWDTEDILGKVASTPEGEKGNTRRFRDTRELDHCIAAKIQWFMRFKNRNTFLFLFAPIDMFYRF